MYIDIEDLLNDFQSRMIISGNALEKV